MVVDARRPPARSAWRAFRQRTFARYGSDRGVWQTWPWPPSMSRLLPPLHSRRSAADADRPRTRLDDGARARSGTLGKPRRDARRSRRRATAPATAPGVAFQYRACPRKEAIRAETVHQPSGAVAGEYFHDRKAGRSAFWKYGTVCDVVDPNTSFERSVQL